MKRLCFTVLMAGVMLAAGASSFAAVEWIDGSFKNVYNTGFPFSEFYGYAPCAIRAGQTEHVWFCRNLAESTIRDHIFYLERENEQTNICQAVLAPGGTEAWDSFHVCDPSVVAGDFQFDGLQYKYALFYLGTSEDASKDNQIGVAFSNDLCGSWKKHPKPLITHKADGKWGVGQPTAVNMEGKGKVVLFYTKGEKRTGGCFREVDLSNMSKPVIGSEKKVPAEGLTQTDGSPDYLNNFDIALDPGRDRFYVVREQHPYPLTDPTIITPSLQIASIPAKDLMKSKGKWTVEAGITPTQTGYLRNHNGGILRTAFGTLPDTTQIKIFFSTSCSGPDCKGKDSLWTYSMWEITGLISEAKK